MKLLTNKTKSFVKKESKLGFNCRNRVRQKNSIQIENTYCKGYLYWSAFVEVSGSLGASQTIRIPYTDLF